MLVFVILKQDRGHKLKKWEHWNHIKKAIPGEHNAHSEIYFEKLPLALIAGLSLSFPSPVALFSTPFKNLLLCGWNILLTTGKFTLDIKGKSNILSYDRCYQLRSLMTSLPCSIEGNEIYMLESLFLETLSKVNIRFKKLGSLRN